MSGSYKPGDPALGPGVAANGGVGVWVNDASNGAFVYGNNLSGSAENGVDVLRSKSTMLQGNVVWGNYQGGIWVANVPDDSTIHSTAPVPQDTVLQGNNSYYNTLNAQIFLQGAVTTQIYQNFLSGASATTTPNSLPATTTVGVRIQNTTTASIFENTVMDVGNRAFINDLTVATDARNGGTKTTGATLYRNRFLKGTNKSVVEDPTSGRNGQTSVFVTYDAPRGSNLQFTISDGITVRSSAGAASTTLTADSFTAVAIWPIGARCPSGATLDGFTLESVAGGVFVGAGSVVGHPGCAANQVTGVTLRNLVVNAGTTPAGGHGIEFTGVQRSVIDSCTIAVAYANGIILDTGSAGNVVMNNTIRRSLTQHALILQNSSDNAVVGNTIVGPVGEGIVLIASARNRVERNAVSGHATDGIVLTTNSNANYVGLNAIVSASYDPVSKPVPSPVSGVGIWVNNSSNGNYLYANDVSGSPENGMDILTSKSTLLQNNSVHGNFQGGIWVANVNFAADPGAPAPQDTVLQGNTVFFNTLNAQIFLQGAASTQVAYNYLSGAQGGTLASTSTAGFQVLNSASAQLFENTVTRVGARAFVSGNTSNAVFFRNRFLQGTNIPNPPQADGLNGVTYSLDPASVQWDAGPFLGGNHWSEFSAAVGNPDGLHPYNAIIGNINGGPNVDNYPFQSETLQVVPGLPSSVIVLEPLAGSVLAAGTSKTIRWIARGCALVDIVYGAGSSVTPIARAFPNVGTFVWGVPAVAPSAGYFVQVACADSSDNLLGPAAQSPIFTIASSNLVLMAPGRSANGANGGTLKVAWKQTAAVPSVNVFVKAGTGPEASFGPFVASSADITLPGAVSNSSQVSVRIQSSANSQDQDSTDGWFMVRGGSPALTTSLGGLSLQIGSVQPLQWVGRSDSYLVDLDLLSGSTLTSSIVKNLPDFGNYLWFVPDLASSSATIRATFKAADGTVLATVSSAPFKVSRNASVLSGIPGAAARHDVDGDGKTDLAVFRPSGGLWFVRDSSRGYSAATPDVFQWALPGDVPLSADFDGDGRIDLTVYRPSNGTWYVRFSSLGYALATSAAYQWGLAGDVPIVGDFDGDGRTDLTVYRPADGTWYIRYSSQSYSLAQAVAVQWGLGGDVPMVGDFDGDGKTDLTVFRPSNGTWYIRYSSLGNDTAHAIVVQWGLTADVPLLGDFDGDGKTDIAVFRPSNGFWFVRYSSLANDTAHPIAYQWGLPGDTPVVGDFDGDGKTDLAVFRPANGTWYVNYSSRGYNPATADAFQWGLAGDVPVQ